MDKTEAGKFKSPSPFRMIALLTFSNSNYLKGACYEAFGYLKRVIVTPAVYPRLIEFLHFDIQSTGQKSHCVNTE